MAEAEVTIYDRRGNCKNHPQIQLRRRNALGRWKVVLDACPLCEVATLCSMVRDATLSDIIADPEKKAKKEKKKSSKTNKKSQRHDKDRSRKNDCGSLGNSYGSSLDRSSRSDRSGSSCRSGASSRSGSSRSSRHRRRNQLPATTHYASKTSGSSVDGTVSTCLSHSSRSLSFSHPSLLSTSDDFPTTSTTTTTTTTTTPSSASSTSSQRHTLLERPPPPPRTQRVVVAIPYVCFDTRRPGYYTGQVDDETELPHGVGTLRFEDGGISEGEWQNGRLTFDSSGGMVASSPDVLPSRRDGNGGSVASSLRRSRSNPSFHVDDFHNYHDNNNRAAAAAPASSGRRRKTKPTAIPPPPPPPPRPIQSTPNARIPDDQRSSAHSKTVTFDLSDRSDNFNNSQSSLSFLLFGNHGDDDVHSNDYDNEWFSADDSGSGGDDESSSDEGGSSESDNYFSTDELDAVNGSAKPTPSTSRCGDPPDADACFHAHTRI
mmetsp:Transcript_7801/g.15599  ORF Transcript_7801/g.15599 Transcript_7801/m.15599 type:complete len:488 (+) Transcript_7801:320-1783(+)